MASWGRGRGDGVYARLRRSPEQYFLALHVGQALFSTLRGTARGGWVARWKRTVTVVLTHVFRGEKPARALAALFFTLLYKLVSYRPLAREMRPRLKVGTAVYDQRARGLL